MSVRSILVLLGGLVLGAGLFPACTPGSSQSPSSPDTTTVESGGATPGDSSVPTGRAGATGTSASPDGASRSVSQRLADASVSARAKQALARHRTLRRFDFAASTVRGRLTLRGDVESREQYRKAERVVSALEGVAAVTNDVTVDGRPAAAADDSSSPSDPTYHTVRRGDTLSDIARRYGVSVRQLRSLNDLSAALQPGERIRVR